MALNEIVETEARAAPERGGKYVVAAVGGLVLAAALGIFLVLQFVEGERQRDLQAWQVRLGLVADSRAAAVDAWLDEQYATLQGLADNAALQLYVTELELLAEQTGGDVSAAAQGGYLANLLVATADAAGFSGPVLGPDINANVNRTGLAGLALVDTTGAMMVATPGMPAPQLLPEEWLVRVAQGQQVFSGLRRGPNGVLLAAFAVPIYAVQADSETAAPIGAVIGQRLVGDRFFALLDQPGETLDTAETYLVRVQDGTVDYLSPLSDDTPPLKLSLAADPEQLAAAFAVQRPGGFARLRDYAGTEVLVTSRRLSTAPWTLVRKVSTDEALADSEGRSRFLLITLISSLLIICLVIVAVWRHGTSLRARDLAARYRAVAERYGRLSDFMRLVADHQPTAISTVDATGRFVFANARAADLAGISTVNIAGKDMAAVLGPVPAKLNASLNRQAHEDGEPVTQHFALDGENGEERMVKSDHVPLPDGGTLMVVEDITELVGERERRERALRQLVDTLVTIVDRRDPFAAHHSLRVAMVADAVAAEMGVEPEIRSTVSFAAKLMNIGKILVPKVLLVKPGNFSDDELAQVRGSIQTSAELIADCDFDGPVAETVRQIGERWDGTGPLGLAGEDILLSARIVAVANAFTAMVSPRAHRSGIDFDEALDILRRDSGHAFDRRPLAALANHLENGGGRTEWASFANPPGEAAE